MAATAGFRRVGRLGVAAGLAPLFHPLAKLLYVAAELLDFRGCVAQVQGAGLTPCGFQGEDRLAKGQKRLHLRQPAAIARHVGQRAVQLIGQQQVIDLARRVELGKVQLAELRLPRREQSLEAIETFCRRRQVEGLSHAGLVGLELADQLGHAGRRGGRGLVGWHSRARSGQQEEKCQGREALDPRERPHDGKSWRWVEGSASVPA